MKPLTIVGGGESWKECPFDTEEIWGAATCLIKPGLCEKRYTKVFAFDSGPVIERAVEEALKRGIPVVSLWEYATEQWPTRAIVIDTKSSYFLDTVSRMLGSAIYERYDRLFIYGIDYGPQWQNQQSKSIVSFWLGYAMGRGIDLRLGRGSMRWVYNIGPAPTGIAEEVPVEQRISEHVCVSA